MRKIIVLFVLAVFLSMSTACSANSDKNVSGNAGNSNKSAATADKPGDAVKNPAGQDAKNESGTPAPIKDRVSVTLYYQDKDAYIIPVTLKITNCEGIAKAALTDLVDSSDIRRKLEGYGLIPVLPAGTVVRGISLKNGTATVDLNKNVLNYKNETEERNIVASIVYTLTEFRTIRDVRILVDGLKYGKLKYGTDISGLLNRDNVLLNNSPLNLEKGIYKYDAYVYRSISDNEAYLIPVSKEVYSEDIGKKLEGVVDFISKEYDEKGLYSMIPSGTWLLEYSIKGNLLTLNLSGDIKKYGGGNSRENGILEQLLYSIKQIKGIDRVKILIDGKEDTLPEGTELKSEIPLPAFINEVND